MRSSSKNQFSHQSWVELKARYKFRCVRCSKREENTPEGQLTVDHVIPIKMGGSKKIGNIQPLCLDCNRKKGAEIWDYRDRKFKN